MARAPNAAVRLLKAEQDRLMEGRAELIAAADDPRIPAGVILDQLAQTDREWAEIQDALDLLTAARMERAA